MPVFNGPKTQLRLKNKNQSPAISVTNIQNSTVQVYWGPNQQFHDPDFGPNIYQPPSGWPRANLLYRMLNVCRVLYESADFDVEAFFVQGPSGEYTYGVFTDSQIFNDISNDPTILPGHIDVTYPFPYSTPGEPVYGIQFHGTYSGHSDSPDLTVSGEETTTFQALLSPPFSYNDYYRPNSAIAAAINIAAGIAEVYSPHVPPATEHTEGAPPYDTTFDGPSGTGIKVIKTGNYTVDSYTYNDGSGLTWPPTPFTIPQGYTQPYPTVDLDQRDTLLDNGFNQIAYNLKEAKRNTYPYFGVSNIYQPGSGINAPPTYQFAVPSNAQNWFGANTMNVLVVCKPHTQIPDADINAIKNTYNGFRLYKLIVYIDDLYMQQSNLPVTIISQTVAMWTSFCSTLSDYGVIFGGQTTTNTYYFGGKDIPTDIQNGIFTIFPISGPNAPSSFDPIQDQSSIGTNGYLENRALIEATQTPPTDLEI